MKVYWQQENNFGDKLTPYILKNLFGVDCRFSRSPRRVFGVGSILSYAKDRDVIWGSGLISRYHLPQGINLEVLALRGPLTRIELESIGVPNIKEVIYGDPALLLPRIYFPDTKKIYKVGYIPHYTDYDFVKSYYDLDELNGVAKVIDVRDPIETVINEALSCDYIISSSLHGLIIADAYGIPNKRAIYNNKLVGGDFKFEDYKQSKKLINLDRLVEVFKLYQLKLNEEK